MLEIIKGDKSIKVPSQVLTAGIVAMGVCAVVADICNAIGKRK